MKSIKIRKKEKRKYGKNEKENNWMTANTIQIRKKGSVTIPMEIRNKYDLNEGDILTLIDLGDGAFMLTPRISQVNRLGRQIAEIVQEENISLDDLLNSLDEERERYYKDHYAAD
jgi:AbrB family looped-hinge helix DNA binding protein